jgi:pyrroloquinoline quinone biosynthesis protein B
MKKRRIYIAYTALLVSTIACNTSSNKSERVDSADSKVTLVVLGNVQDAGSPQIGCEKSCCKPLWSKPIQRRMVSSLGILDHETGQTFVFDATPDLKYQWEILKGLSNDSTNQPSGIFLTHAHMGHYTGLLDLGREAMNANEVPVFAMPGMERFLMQNGPWNQLVHLNQIVLNPLQADSTIQVSKNISVQAICVPHREEYSETVGFVISGPNKKVLYIPDIDKWEKWEHSIQNQVKDVDYAFLDATFFNGDELPGRDMSEIPHPSIEETIALFEDAEQSEKNKIHFIHFNHTNPVLNPAKFAKEQLRRQGFRVAEPKMKFEL